MSAVLNIEEFAMPAGLQTSGGHGHARWHLVAALEGDLEEEVGRRVHSLAAGDIRLSPGGACHRLAFGSRGARLIVLETPDHWAPAGLSRRTVQADHLFLYDPETVAAVSDILALPAEASVARELAVLALFARLNLATSPGGGLTPPEWLEEARARIADPDAAESRVARLARTATVSREHFTRLFTLHYGCSPAAYRRAVRTQAAMELIRDTDQSLAEIACEAGFTDQSHLTNVVRARFGVTPAAARAAAASQNCKTAAR